ncbi:uncharacterized protein LOC126833766 [Adelges cooleyi]|uniref:uncharacterized protein LOC126833766 n=1 Tax=Adelges cooleyi TaxID=133065 RepID=UPI0021800738|nr:uncharacterized protein LOC126833766 [Adelges cooleyi]
MPVSNGTAEKNTIKKQKKWSLLGILSKKKKLKTSQESMDFCPYEGKFNQNVARKSHLERNSDGLCVIQQYTRSPRPIKRCHSMQYTAGPLSNVSGRSDWRLSQQSVYSTGSSACYSDTGVYRGGASDNRRAHPVVAPPFRCSSEVGHYRNKILARNLTPADRSGTNRSKQHLIGKKIPPPPPPRNPNVKAVYYYENNRLVSRESDSNYFSQSSDEYSPTRCDRTEGLQLADDDDNDNVFRYDDNSYTEEPGPRSRCPIQICDVETLSSECVEQVPRTQSVEEALQELEDIYNSLGLSDDDLLDRAERRDLPTAHQNMRYESFDETDYATSVSGDRRMLSRSSRRSGVPNVVSDDMAYRRLNRRETKKDNPTFLGSFLLVLPSMYNLDTNPTVVSKEPDATLDDVVFRSRRQHRNCLKVPDPQPPFGIPLGPIVAAAPSDYLHAVPEGRYKPTFHPRRTPDTVEDDLAFRSLRKDNCKTGGVYFNVSYVHRDRFRINGALVPRSMINRLAKDDAHWIIKNPLAVDYPTSDKHTNVVIVKVDQHKPIVLTGFTLDEADRLSKSLVCTQLPPSPREHEYRRKRLLSNSRAAIYRSNKALPLVPLKPSSKFVAGSPVSPPEEPRQVNRVDYDVTAVASTETGKPLAPELTGLDDNAGGSCRKGQPNFRELIRREYANRFTTDQIDWHATNSVHGHRRRVSPSVLTDELANTGKTVVGTIGPQDTVRKQSDAEVSQTEETLKGFSLSSGQHMALVPWSSSKSTADLTVPPRRTSPGYLEVCLYLIVCLYQLLSVNAFSTLIALILLIALHFCRSLS